MSAFLDSQNLKAQPHIAGEPGWLSALRIQTRDTVLTSGLPTAKTEAWRFTSLRSLANQSIGGSSQEASNDALSWAQEQLGEQGTLPLYLVNGRPAGTIATAEGLEVLSLQEALSRDAAALKPVLGKLAHSEFFSALNTALFCDGYVVRVGAAYRGPAIQLVHISDGAQACYPRVIVEASANANFTLIESYLSRSETDASLCATVTEIDVGDGAHLEHVRVMEGGKSSTHLGTLAVVQQRNSHYTSRSIAMGGKLARLEIDARMVGPGCECKLEGMYHAIGNEHIAHHTRITHADSHGTSIEEYRGLIDDRAHAVFDGIIIVNRDTKGTSAHQQNHNLLLSDGATINTKPHLEIDSDDLSASHGATVGSVNPDHLFFLRARGINENHARSILTFSFVRSIVDRISTPLVRERLIAKLLSRLPYGEEIAELAE